MDNLKENIKQSIFKNFWKISYGKKNKKSELNMQASIKYKSIKDIIQLATDEEVVKDYFAATVKKPSYGEAHFAITNKRLIMYIWSEETVKVNSVNIADIVSTSVYQTERSFSILINIKAATGAFTFYTYPHSLLEKALHPNKLDLESAVGPDMALMSKQLGALVLNMRKNVKPD
jgi:hypothetical protein